MQEVDAPLQWVTLESRWIYEDNTSRLDASFYSQDIMKARRLIEALKKRGVRVENLGSKSFSKEIFWPGRFKRKYVSKKNGKPFLMPSEIFMFLPRARKFVTDFPENVLIDEKWILVTRSGTIGRCMISNKLLSSFVLSDDLVRVVPIQHDLAGYIYAYLNTWVGQAFLTKNQYGATVKHIEPHHVASIPIPILPEIENEINKKILEANKVREKAQKLLLKSEKMIYSELDLPRIDENKIEYFGGNAGKIVKSFLVKASELNLRLDASYNKPILTLIRKILKNRERKGSFELAKLAKISTIFTPPRFKRIYVKDPKDGVPLLQGSHISWIKSLDIKYLWKKMKNLNKYIVKKNWILITCSGTLGKVALVRDYWDGWAATNHMTRIIPSKEINPGYLTIFLMSLYGLYQMETLGYGGVVEEIGEAGELLREVLVPLPDIQVQKKIGTLVLEAYDMKDQANMIEDKTVNFLEKRLEDLSKSIT